MNRKHRVIIESVLGSPILCLLFYGIISLAGLPPPPLVWYVFMVITWTGLLVYEYICKGIK